jgi:putative tryptophan/tyrosine transport system substrate-binding protein
MHRIGFLSVSDAPSSSPNRGAFIDGMRELGYQEGKDYFIEPRYAEGKLDRLPSLAAELVQQKVELIVLGSIPAALAAQKATKSIPIVVAAAGDFVGNGLVTSLERPGFNITGLDEVVPGLAGERLRLLAQAVPLRSPVAVFPALRRRHIRSKCRTQNLPPHHWDLTL